MSIASSTTNDPATRLFLYLAVGGILAFELTVLYLAKFPRVNDAYVSYYVKHESACYGSGTKSEIRIGEPILVANLKLGQICALFGKGWSNQEEWGIWTDGNVAQLSLALPPAVRSSLRLTFDAGAASRTDHQSVTISALGVPIGSVDVAARGDAQYSVMIPKAIVDQHAVALEFSIADPVSPKDLGESGDSRRLGLALHWLRLDPVNDAPPK